MGNSSLIIVLVVGIIVVKLVAVHLYLKKNINQSKIKNATTSEKQKSKDDE